MKNVHYFNEWNKLKSTSGITRATTSDIYNYVTYLQNSNVKTGTINIRLNSIRKYYACLIKLVYLFENQALSIRIGGTVNKVLESPLSDIELKNLTQNFNEFIDTKPKPNNIKEKANLMTKQRYKLIVSLLIYQELDTVELKRLYVSDIDMKKYTVYIASKFRRNSRTLKLETTQVVELYNYLQSHPPNQEKLFSINPFDAMIALLSYLKGLEPRIRNTE
jgi:site-specific recombinase XerD